MSRQKNSILINEHSLNRAPVPLIQLQAKKIYRSPEKHPFERPYDPGLTAANKKVAEKIDFASFKNFSWLFQFAQLLIEIWLEPRPHSDRYSKIYCLAPHVPKLT